MSREHDQLEKNLTGIALCISGVLQKRKLQRQIKEAERAAGEAARLAEKKANRKNGEWLAKVSAEMSRGSAGNATEAEAKAALGGRGGRPNPLDERMF